MRRVGIIGAGASGTITAARILELCGPEVEVALLDPSKDPGPGFPYRTRNPDHLLNVSADKMSALDDDSDHFLRWARARDRSIGPDSYVSRGVYGEYLRNLIRDSTLKSRPGNRPLLGIQAEVRGIRREDRALILEADGFPPLRCDEVVLAIGSLSGASPVKIGADLAASGRYIDEIWQDEWLSAAEKDDLVLIVGSGLTAVDVALSISRFRKGPRMLTLSRSALFPRGHSVKSRRIDSPKILPEGPIGLEEAITCFFSLESQAMSLGGDWRDAMDALRRVTPDIWRRMPLADKRRFLDEFSRVWEVHRHRMAPEVSNRFARLLESGRLSPRRGHLTSLDLEADQVVAEIETDESLETITVDRVINCTGAGRDVTREGNPLVTDLLGSGLAREDDLCLGLDVTHDGRAIGDDGNPSPGLSVVGPLRRGVEWEAIAIPEIRVQAGRIARRLTSEAETEELTTQLVWADGQ